MAQIFFWQPQRSLGVIKTHIRLELIPGHQLNQNRWLKYILQTFNNTLFQWFIYFKTKDYHIQSTDHQEPNYLVCYMIRRSLSQYEPKMCLKVVWQTSDPKLTLVKHPFIKTYLLYIFWCCRRLWMSLTLLGFQHKSYTKVLDIQVKPYN